MFHPCKNAPVREVAIIGELATVNVSMRRRLIPKGGQRTYSDAGHEAAAINSFHRGLQGSVPSTMEALMLLANNSK
jgi:hypothetical protein